MTSQRHCSPRADQGAGPGGATRRPATTAGAGGPARRRGPGRAPATVSWLLLGAILAGLAGPAGAHPGRPGPPSAPATVPGPPTPTPFPTSVSLPSPASAATPTTGEPAAPPGPKGGGIDVRPLGPEEVIDVPEAPSSRLARSDPGLLGRDDATPVAVLAKFDYDAVSAYAGHRRGLPATSPSVTGQPLTRARATTSPYARQLARDEGAILDGVTRAVPGVEVGRRLRVAYGGVALRLPADRVADLLAVDGVVAVHEDRLEQLHTDASPALLGAPEAWAAVGGRDDAGHGLLLASIDTGLWPEHPSFADDGSLPPAPTDTAGHPLPCAYGDNPLTPAPDVFACNDKLVGGAVHLDTYVAVHGPVAQHTTARDVDGHGTHTASTAAGRAVTAATAGQPRGTVSGVAPGAWVIGYKVCGPAGCYLSDAVAAVEQAILHGVDVINFSIGGGRDPWRDPVELAFLDAYAAGIFVAASAGNSGPGAGTVDHQGPWVTTVAATTQARRFQSTLHLDSAAGAGPTLTGTSTGPGVPTATPVVAAQAVAGYASATCQDPPPAGAFAGRIVACRTGGVASPAKSKLVAAGGGVGMILYGTGATNPDDANHWVPTIRVDDGAALADALGRAGLTGTFTAGTAVTGAADAVAPFSSRGPAALTLKPDLAAPGVSVLAATTPGPDPATSNNPPGELYLALNGTSMAAPHVAGAALLLRARHPTWTPGQIQSALVTTAGPTVTTPGGTTPAGPDATGGGRVALARAGQPGLVLDEDAGRFHALAGEPASAVHLNLPSVHAPAMPGRLTTTRTVTNVGGAATYAVTATGPGGSVTATPATFTVPAGGSQEIVITLAADTLDGQPRTGAVTLTAPGRPDVRLPVSFVPTAGPVAIAPDGCEPAAIPAHGRSTCRFLVSTTRHQDTVVDLRAVASGPVAVVGAGPDGVAAAPGIVLAGGAPPGLALAPAGPPTGTWTPLASLGASPTAVGDEAVVNYSVPTFWYAGREYERIGVTSNGYLVVGGGTAADVTPHPQALPDPAAPDNVLAPFWTDLTGAGAPGLRATLATVGPHTWIAVEWHLAVAGGGPLRQFQAWLRVGSDPAGQDVRFAYDPAALPTHPGRPFVVGAENHDGSAGAALPGLPTQGLAVALVDPVPHPPTTWTVDVEGTGPGVGTVTASLTSPSLAGTALAHASVTVAGVPPAEDFVRRAYVVVLGRAGDEAGVRYWTDRVAAGADPDGVVAAMAVGAEARDQIVDRSYRTAFHRPSEPAGRAYWADKVARGLAPDDLLATLLASPEAYQRAGGTPAGFADHLYRIHLDRPADPGGVQYWTGQLASRPGAIGRRAAAVRFGRTAEATRIAVRRAVALACDPATDPPAAVLDALDRRYVDTRRNPLLIAGSALAHACPPGS